METEIRNLAAFHPLLTATRQAPLQIRAEFFLFSLRLKFRHTLCASLKAKKKTLLKMFSSKPGMCKKKDIVETTLCSCYGYVNVHKH